MNLCNWSSITLGSFTKADLFISFSDSWCITDGWQNFNGGIGGTRVRVGEEVVDDLIGFLHFWYITLSAWIKLVIFIVGFYITLQTTAFFNLKKDDKIELE